MYKALRESNFDGPREGGTVQRAEGSFKEGEARRSRMVALLREVSFVQ